MWSLVIPIDTIKSRLQSAPQGTYSGFMDCARKIMAAGGGTGALFRGFGRESYLVVKCKADFTISCNAQSGSCKCW